jgi:hypothetical protein
MRKKNGIRPSETGFYHDEIRANRVAKNDEFMKIKAARLAI